MRYIIYITALFFISSCATMSSKKQQIKQLHNIWSLTHLKGQEVTNEQFKAIPHLEINLTENTFQGNDGCNSYSGTFSTGGKNNIELMNISATEMYCEDSPESLHYQKLLQESTKFSVSNNNLFMQDSKNQNLLQFKKAE